MGARAFEAVVGAAHVAPGTGLLEGARVEAVVSPANAAELAACVEVAEGERLPLVARGGGSKLHWGNPLAAPRIAVLDTTRLTDPCEIDADEGVAQVGAGMRLDALSRALAGKGKRCLLEPLFPGSTVGGAIAADPIGPDHSLDGRPRFDLLGIEVVLASGRSARAGGSVVKNVTGFDLVRLYCGSLGTLGLITRATVRLRAIPALERVCAREYPEVEAALGGAGALRAAGLEPGGVALRIRRDGCQLLWRLVGSEAAVARAATRFPGDALPPGHWESLRRTVRGADLEGWVSVRLGARATDCGALCTGLGAHGGRLRVVLPFVGIVFADLPASALGALLADASAAGWALFVERAPLEVRERIDVFGPPPGGLALMRALKTRFDPHGLFAPGRFAGRC